MDCQLNINNQTWRIRKAIFLFKPKLFLPKYQGIEIIKNKNPIMQPKVIGITRVRNEESIFVDTLKHVSQFVNTIIVLDDHSQDSTINIAKESQNVCMVLFNKEWSENRILEETRHRSILLDYAKQYNPQWIFYFDADERFEGINLEHYDEPQYLGVDAIRIKLFDAYLTPDDCDDYKQGQMLWNSRKFFGAECREIVMLWRNRPYIRYEGLDSREPKGFLNTRSDFYCQHFGKAISVKEWESTCDYYSRWFPEPYSSKWLSRKGKAIHTTSDFDTPLLL